MMTYVIGIDGGGTKTTGVIADDHGEVFAEATVGPSNPNSVTKERIKQEFDQLFAQLRKVDTNAFEKVDHVFAGLSGADHLTTRAHMKQLIEKLLPEKFTVSIDNDAITALYSGTLGKPGIVQIAGTGAITYGVNDQGVRKRVGGWGYLFSDHGSGYSLGRDALAEVFLAHDGFDRDTLLSKKIMAHFAIDELPDLIRIIYHQPGTREVIAALSRLVMESADQGDKIAKEIIQRNANHLGQSISLLVDQLFYNKDEASEANQVNDHNTPVILVGGLFNRLDLLQKSIQEGLSSNQEKVYLKMPEILPVGGAIIAALLKEDINVNQDFVKHFQKQLSQ